MAADASGCAYFNRRTSSASSTVSGRASALAHKSTSTERNALEFWQRSCKNLNSRLASFLAAGAADGFGSRPLNGIPTHNVDRRSSPPHRISGTGPSVFDDQSTLNESRDESINGIGVYRRIYL